MGRPFRAKDYFFFSKPSALRWAVMALPLWGETGDTADVLSALPVLSWMKLALGGETGDIRESARQCTYLE
jgi:hypothetical protein